MHLNAKFTDVTRVHVQIRRLRAICREDLFPVFISNLSKIPFGKPHDEFD